jgi:hypothetical protein
MIEFHCLETEVATLPVEHSMGENEYNEHSTGVNLPIENNIFDDRFTTEVESTINSPSPEMLIHLYCISKNLSTTAEKELFALISCTKFNKFDTSFDQFQKLKNVPSIKCNIYQCNVRPSNYKNTKPHNTLESSKVPISVYSVADHLRLYLASPMLAPGLVTKPTFEGSYTDFTSGNYFTNLCKALPSSVLPLCCM